jgi:predicted nucleotidyltransferase
MRQERIYPEVNDVLLSEIVRRMCDVGHPHKIVLFGSRARGDAQPDSDLDLLVIEDSTLPRHKRATRYRRALVDVFPAKDIVVWTPEEVREWSEVPNAFINVTLKEGKILYER